MFDPNIPQAGTEIDAVQMRSQLNGLKDLIDAGPTITSAVVDAVNTLPAGDLASVGVTITNGVLHLTFGIPEGQSGPPGEVSDACRAGCSGRRHADPDEQQQQCGDAAG